MKKTTLLLPIFLLSLAGCNKTQAYNLDLKVLAPTGAPAISLYNFALSDNLTTTTNPQTGLIPMFKTGEYDVIVAPTQGGLTQIVKQNAQYKIAATVTFGNFYIVSTGSDTDNELNSGDSIIAFQENDIPGKVFKYLYGDMDLDVQYVAGAADTKQIMENNGLFDGKQYDYIYTAEPVMSAANKTCFINIQDAFKTKSGGKSMTQASVFIKNGVDSSKANAFLSALEKSINDGLNNPNLFKAEIEKLGSVTEQQNKFGVPGAMAKKVGVNNGFGLGYKNAKTIKDEIQSFVNLLTNNTIGELNEEVFYQ